MKYRKETDAIGSVNVPVDSYGGSFYVRAKRNFQISGTKAEDSFKVALGRIKMVAARVNAGFGHLDKKKAEAIWKAGEEFIAGKFDADYDLDVYQAGAGTPFNMNLNEILANRANELLGGKKGEYKFVHPNNDVNAGQSSNDVIPTAIRIAALMDLKDFMKAGNGLVKAFEVKAKKFGKVVKVGRTHLQDAVPVTLGQEFGAWASAVKHGLERVEAAGKNLTVLGIGGTATGSGINTHPDFAKKMIKELSSLSGLKLSVAENKFETTHSAAAFLSLSAALRGLAVEIHRIAEDLRLLASGPYAGFNEINLPEVEPGSSIMPGKVNPSVTECMSMICVQVMGLDHAICLAAQDGQLELNWYTPLIMKDLLHQIKILTNGMRMFDKLCVSGVTVNGKNIKNALDKSTVMATALAPYMGYHEVAELVNEAIEKNVPFETLVPAKYKKYLGVEKMTRPNRTAWTK